MKVQLLSIEQVMALPASGLLIATSQPPNPNRGLGGAGGGPAHEIHHTYAR